MAIRVLIVDDHLVVRRGVQSLLTQYPDIEVVGEADQSEAALEQVTALRPDLVLLDIRLAGVSGLELARRIHRLSSSTRVIVLTSYDDESYLVEAAQAGVAGYLLKSASPEELADAIRAAHAGERRLSREMAGKALGQLRILSRAHARSESGLSDQELQLLQLIADGADTQDMVKVLYLSERTIARKIQDILDKLGAANRAQAVAEAYKRGLL